MNSNPARLPGVQEAHRSRIGQNFAQKKKKKKKAISVRKQRMNSSTKSKAMMIFKI